MPSSNLTFTVRPALFKQRLCCVPLTGSAVGALVEDAAAAPGGPLRQARERCRPHPQHLSGSLISRPSPGVSQGPLCPLNRAPHLAVTPPSLVPVFPAPSPILRLQQLGLEPAAPSSNPSPLSRPHCAWWRHRTRTHTHTAWCPDLPAPQTAEEGHQRAGGVSDASI